MRFLAGRRVEISSYVVVSLVASLLVVYAMRADGYSYQRADLNDGGIWVTNSSVGGGFGRLNKPIGELDGVARPTGVPGAQKYDVLQRGGAVVGWNVGTSELYEVDGTKAALSDGGTTAIEPQSDVALGGGTLAVISRASGKVWASVADPVDDGLPRDGVPLVGGVDKGGKVIATVGRETAGTVTDSGKVIAVSAAADTLTVLTPAGEGWAAPVVVDLDLSGAPKVTAVGDVPVVLDTGSGRLTLRDGATATVSPDAVLQQPGPAADDVLVTTDGDLLSIDLVTGDTLVLATGGGAPSAAVRLGSCSYGAWSGSPLGAVVSVCSDDEIGREAAPVKGGDLVLRSNRGEVVLNDRLTGAVYNIDDQRPERVDNWDSFAPQERDKNDTSKNSDSDEADPADEPPKANPDTLGARPGATTVLHVLDNDKSAGDSILAIESLGRLTPPGAAVVTASPDGQAVLVSLPDDAVGSVGFEYTVNAGGDKTATAHVTVPVKASAAHSSPSLRTGAEADLAKRRYTVPAGGSINVSVLGDWRDPGEGDAVTLTAARSDAGRASVTTAGQVRFDAAKRGGVQVVDYDVTDSDGSGAAGSIRVVVQKPNSFEAVPPQAENDLARGVVGKPITIEPLANDIPGSDPLNLNAVLTLATPVSAPAGLGTPTSDLDTGRVTLVPTRAGTYQFTYQAGFGDAATSQATVRVDVAPGDDTAAPVAVPDAVTLFGTSQGIVDVLANDYDPQGRVLVTQSASLVGDPAPIEISVVSGHWVRVRATGPVQRNPVTVRYSITNGQTGGQQDGELVVRLAEAVDRADDRPITTDDFANVRAGGGVVVPVLDNDSTPSGAPVSLQSGGSAGNGGSLTVTPDIGRATVSGRLVRYTAPPPSEVDAIQSVDIEYVATNSANQTEVGTVHVTVSPAPSETFVNQAPNPPTIEARVVAGDAIRIKVPSGGVDPDGDAVTVTGIASPTLLGRVTRFGATEVQYQAFPSSAGTDAFDYTVADAYGGVATGTIRVAVVPPGEAQPPVAVDDTIYAAPGREVRVEVMSNDYVAAGDVVTIEDLADTNADVGDAQLLSPTGPIVLKAAQGRPVSVDYRLVNGVGSRSLATVTVQSVPGYNNPPVVFDAYGTLEGEGAGDVVTADVLAGAYDPDAEDTDVALRSVAPSAAGEVRFTKSGKVTVPLAEFPQVLPFEAVDGDGGAASAFLYVPARPAGLPYLVSDDTIRLKPGSSRDLDLSDLVADPAGRPLRLTIDDQQQAAPKNGLRLETPDERTLRLSAADGYVGPGVLTFEVTNGATVGAEDAATVVFTLKVQVGSEDPQLRCPDDELTLVEGGAPLSVDIASYCHVWTPDPADLGGLTFAARAVSGSLQGVEISPPGGVVVLRAPGGVGATRQAGEIEVSVPGTDATGTLRVSVRPAGPPTLTPVAIQGVKADESRTIDLGPRFYSPLADGVATIVSLTPAGRNVDATASVVGADQVLFDLGHEAAGQMSWDVVMTDVAPPGTDGRQARSTITLDVLGFPDTPGTPKDAAKQAQSEQAQLSWSAPRDDGGAPITGYVVTVKETGKQVPCGSAPTCTVKGLENGRDYHFSVVAHNVVGDSMASPVSAAITPDAQPGPIFGIAQQGPSTDHHVSLTWNAPQKDTSIKGYVVSREGFRRRTSQPTFDMYLPSNNKRFTITVVAENALGFGPERSITLQSSGRPATPGNVRFEPRDTAKEETVVTVSWNHSNWEGPSGHYVVTRSDGFKEEASASRQAVTQTLPYDGSKYSWSVVAINGTADRAATHTSAPGKSDSFVAAEVPETPVFTTAEATGADEQGHFVFRAQRVRGTGSTYDLQTSSGTTSGAIGSGETKNVTVPAGTNGSTVSPQVRICNTQKGCSAWTTGDGLIPYGPLDDGKILSLNTGASGQNTTFSTTVDTNGRSATVTVTGSRGYSRTWSGINSRRSGALADSHFVGYSATETFTVTISDSGRGSGRRSAVSPKTADPPPAPPTISNFIAVPGGCCGNPGQVGVAWDTRYPSGSSGGFCHWSRDGADLEDERNCPGDGRASRQFLNQPLGSHRYCGWIRMPDNSKSNVMCQTITVSK